MSNSATIFREEDVLRLSSLKASRVMLSSSFGLSGPGHCAAAILLDQAILTLHISTVCMNVLVIEREVMCPKAVRQLFRPYS